MVVIVFSSPRRHQAELVGDHATGVLSVLNVEKVQGETAEVLEREILWHLVSKQHLAQEIT